MSIIVKNDKKIGAKIPMFEKLGNLVQFLIFFFLCFSNKDSQIQGFWKFKGKFFSRFQEGIKLIFEDWEEKRQVQKNSRLGCQVFPLYPFIFA